jgi:predicted methyltransferase
MPKNASQNLSGPMQRVLAAMQRGAQLRYSGWQQVVVSFPGTPERFVAREQTLYALRDRGLVTMDKNGVNLTDAGKNREA